jgi:hypothetical protein
MDENGLLAIENESVSCPSFAALSRQRCFASCVAGWVGAFSARTSALNSAVSRLPLVSSKIRLIGTVSPAFTCLHLPFQVDEHDVEASRFQGYGLASRKRQALNLAHTHHVVFDGHLVHFNRGSDGRTRANKFSGAGGGQLHEGTSGSLLGDGCPNPRLFNAHLRLG